MTFGDRIAAVTERGAVAIESHEKLRPFASESITKQSWSHRVDRDGNGLPAPCPVLPPSAAELRTSLNWLATFRKVPNPEAVRSPVFANKNATSLAKSYVML